MEYWLQCVLVVIVGLVTGFINTLAGSGSLLSLPFLMFLGLPADVANGTNRIGILFQSAVATAGFRKKNIFRWKEAKYLVTPFLIGSFPGAFVASTIPAHYLNYAIGFLLLFMFFIILYKPEQWLQKKETTISAGPGVVQYFIFFAIGLYGGFIQAGVGFFLLGGLVLGAKLSLLKANALKVLITAALTIIALPVFIYFGKVDFSLGLIMATGSIAGAWLATKTALRKGPSLIRIFLLVMILISALKLLVFEIIF